MKSLTEHEFGHHLMGGNEMHTGSGFWGMMYGYGSRCNLMNSYERHRLGWTTFFEYDYNPPNPISLGDYATTGQCLRIYIPNTNPKEYYLLENHERISYFDKPDQVAGAKGLFVIKQNGPLNSNLHHFAADSKWNWSVDHYDPNPWGSGELPVFVKGTVNPTTGYFDTDVIPYIDPITGQQKSSYIYFYEDPTTGQDIQDALFLGDGRDAFNIGYQTVLSPWSNPRALNKNNGIVNIAFEVVDDQYGVIKVKQYVVPNTQVQASPSKPQSLAVEPEEYYGNWHPHLTWNANEEPDINFYKIEKYATYELGWQLLGYSVTPDYLDMGKTYCPPGRHCANGSRWVRYRVRAVDTQYKVSVPSDSVMTNVRGAYPDKQVAEQSSIKKPTEYTLSQNYPNPFNPTTKIKFQIPADNFVSLKVYNTLGQEVSDLLNEIKTAGTYQVIFDAGKLSSGIYYYVLKAGLEGSDFVKAEKMLLLK